MTLSTLCVLALLLPQEGPRPGRLVLPKPSPETQKPAPPMAAQDELLAFHKAVLPLRRGVHLNPNAEDLLLRKLGQDFQAPGELALRLMPQVDPDQMHGLLRVLLRYGKESDGDAIQLLLMTRAIGEATPAAVDAMARLLRDNGKEALFVCMTARFAGVRQAAAERLLSLVQPEDLPRLLQLSRDRNEDVQRRALFLLGAVHDAEARKRLLEALASPSTQLAASAAQSLLAHGPDAAIDLQAILSEPPTSRAFGHAALLLAQFEDQTGRQLLTDAMLPHLRAELRGPDPFLRAACAVALCNLAFRSDDRTGERFDDAGIAEGLLLVAAPREFVPNTSLLQAIATHKLMLFSGQDFRGRAAAWLKWWDERGKGFVGTRLRIEVGAENGRRALLTWRDPQRVLRIRGEELPLPPVPDSKSGPAASDLILSGAEMQALVQKLRELGFMTPGILAAQAAAETLPQARALELELLGSRVRIAGPATTARWLDVLESELLVVAAREQWQLYRDPATEPDPLAFWRAEREWLAAHTDRGERDRRLLGRIVDALPKQTTANAELALRSLLAMPDLGALLTEEHGLKLAAFAAQRSTLDELGQRALEGSILAPGDQAWRAALQAAEQHYDQGGRQLLGKLYGLLGPERTLAAIGSGRPRVRTAAMFDVANQKELRAVPILLAQVGDAEREVADTAIYALGMIGDPQAREPLLRLLATPELRGSTRRETWMALARIGGDDVLPVLQNAATSLDFEDRLKGLEALGEYRDPRSAAFLAQVFTAHGTDPIGTQAFLALKKLGGLLARPALHRCLNVRDPRVRREVVLALADIQDPIVVPELIEMLELPADGPRASVLLACITGVDLTPINDRVGYMRRWWQSHKELPQGSWFLEALRTNGVQTALTIGQLAPRSGTAGVPELIALLPRLEKPYLRVLAGALLRDSTDREFGTISLQTTIAQLQAITDRYAFYAEAEARPKGR
jgi:HEAT repeat protein